ncbi:MAG: HD domain-containing phosphohydrolase, partial [Gemmatimonadaceae bacterium]
PRRPTPIRFGAIGLRGAAPSEGQPLREQDLDLSSFNIVDVSEEADAVSWVHGEVLRKRVLHVGEAELVVGSLSAAMHGDRNLLLPLLTLKDFDQYTTTHALNVAVLAMGLAEYMGLSGREARAYGVAGLLHDLGKVKVPTEILRKPGALTDDERAILQRHPVDGAQLILSGSKKHDLCAVVAFEHHIMIDGGGYPHRQARRDCHHASLLVHVCDVFDALRTHRPYRVAWVTSSILAYIERRVGTEFDADVARAFMRMMEEWEMRHALADSLETEAPEALTTF